MNPHNEILTILEDIQEAYPQLREQTDLIRYVLNEDIELHLRVDRIRELLNDITISDMTLQMQIFSLNDLLLQLSDTEHESVPDAHSQ